MSLEAVAVRLGTSIAGAAVRAIVGKQERKQISANDLRVLAEGRFPLLERRTIERRIEDMGDTIARRLEPLYRNEFPDTTDSSKERILTLTATCIEQAVINDRRLFETNLSAAELSGAIREEERALIRSYELEPRERELFGRAILEGCQCLIQTVLTLKPFTSRAVLEVLVRQSRLEEKLDELLRRLPRPLFGSRSGSDFNEFHRSYINSIIPQLDRLDIFGIDVASRLQLKLSLGYIGLSVEEEDSGALLTSELYPHTRSSQSSKLAAVEAFGKGRRFLVRGEAGSGKSTLLRWLAVSAALGEFAGELQHWNHLIPFLVKLRSFAERPLPSVERLFADLAPGLVDAAPDNWVFRTFSAGNGLLLVDGLDELEDAKRYEVRSWLTSLLETFPALTVVVTSRPAAAEPRWLSHSDFASLAIEPLSPSECKTFIRRWHDAAQEADYLPCEKEDLPSFESSLLRELDAKLHLRALAASPLLAAMICALNLDREGQLPADRKDLYEAALDLLLERRDKRRNIRAKMITLPKAAKMTVLRSLALYFSINGQTEVSSSSAAAHIRNTIQVLDVDSTLTEEHVLDYLIERSGVIREPAIGRVDFIHKTFQEFLTAQAAAELDYVGLLIENAHSDRWREVVLMFPPQATEPQRQNLIEGLLHRAASAEDEREKRQLSLLVAVSLRYSVSRSERTEQRSRELLVEVLPPRDLSSASLLASMGPPILSLMPTATSQLEEGVAFSCVRTVAMIGGDAAIKILARYADDGRPRVQRALIDSWDYFDTATYAAEVLAGAPLDAGEVGLTATRAVRHLHQLKSLRKLKLDLGRLIQDRDHKFRDDLAHLSDAAQLRRFELNTRGAGDLSFLSELVYLEDLALWQARGLKEGTILDGMAALRRLLIGEGALGNGVKSLSGILPRLHILGLISPQHEVDISAFRDSELRSLILRKCKILEWRAAERLLTLRSLRIERCELYNLDLSVLAQLPDLEFLSIRDMPDRVQGVKALLEGCRSLREIECDLSLTAEAVQQMRDAGIVVRDVSRVINS